jgi:hypothetical protein
VRVLIASHDVAADPMREAVPCVIASHDAGGSPEPHSAAGLHGSAAAFLRGKSDAYRRTTPFCSGPWWSSIKGSRHCGPEPKGGLQ